MRNLSIRGFWYSRWGGGEGREGVYPGTDPCQILRDSCNCKMLTTLEQLRQHIKKQRHYFANKGLSSFDYGSSSIRAWM